MPLEKPIGKVTVVCVETFCGALSIRQFENVSVFNSGLLAQLCFLHRTVTIFPPGFDSNFLAHPRWHQC